MRRRAYAELTQTASGDFALKSSYDPGLVAALKAQIPSTARRWDPNNKVWLVTEPYLDAVVDIVDQSLGIHPHIQTQFVPPATAVESRMVRLEYLGAAKDCGGGEQVSFGYADGDWSMAIPLSVLKAWFELEEDERPGEAPTLYAVLGVSKSADSAAIKSAFRRAARQWHPDVCQEPDATQQFQRINAAYQVLSDDLTRRKYDAGLKLAGSTRTQRRDWSQSLSAHGWRPPLRCGWLLVEGISRLGRFNVSKIVQWEDIRDSQGKVMVSSWPPGGDTFQVQWV